MRGSPERILYSRSLFIGGLLTALVASAAAQHLFHADPVVFVILRVFAETTLFMMWMVVLTAKVARLRLASAMLCLVWISVLGDALLSLASLLPLTAISTPVAVGWGLVIGYGAANVIGWALRKPLQVGALQVVLYAGAVWALDTAFRTLYQIMAA